MKNFLIFFALLVLISRGEWLQFQHNAAHTGKTETAVSVETILWTRYVPSLSPFSGPAIMNNRIFIPTSNGFYCFSLNGESLWCISGSFDNVPAIHDSIVIVTSNIFLRAFSIFGDSLWQRTFQNQIWHPVIWDTFIFITESDRLWKLRLNGDTVWSRRCSPGFYNAAPAVDDLGRIFVVTLGSTIGWYAFRVYGFNQNGDQIFFHEEWTMSEPGGNRLTPTLTSTGVILATFPQPSWFHGCYLVHFTGGRTRWDGTVWYSSAACDLLRNRIYHVDNNAIVARDLVGNFIWRSSNLGTISYSSPAIDGAGKIFVGSDLGIFYCLNPDGTIRFRYDTGAGILTHPAISSDGKVFIASTSGRLFCFGRRLVGISEELQSQRQRQILICSGTYDISGRRLGQDRKKLQPRIYFKVDSSGVRKIVKFH